MLLLTPLALLMRRHQPRPSPPPTRPTPPCSDHDEFEHAIYELKRKAGVKVGGAARRSAPISNPPACTPPRSQQRVHPLLHPWTAPLRGTPLTPPSLIPQFDCELDASHLRELVAAYKDVYKRAGKVLPQDPYEQLRMGIDAVFRSWMIPRAIKYREVGAGSQGRGLRPLRRGRCLGCCACRLLAPCAASQLTHRAAPARRRLPPTSRQINKITGLKGTAVNVQAMVYGNYNGAGGQSGTGVLFTRNPATGERLRGATSRDRGCVRSLPLAASTQLVEHCACGLRTHKQHPCIRSLAPR